MILKKHAEVVKGKKVADGVEFYVAAASSEVQKESELAGYWQSLIDAGAKPLTSRLWSVHWIGNRFT